MVNEKLIDFMFNYLETDLYRNGCLQMFWRELCCQYQAISLILREKLHTTIAVLLSSWRPRLWQPLSMSDKFWRMMMICWIKSTIKDDWCIDEEHVTKTHQQFIVLSELWRELWSCQRFCLCWLWHRRWHRGLSLLIARRHRGAMRSIHYSWKQRLNSQWLNSRC